MFATLPRAFVTTPKSRVTVVPMPFGCVCATAVGMSTPLDDLMFLPGCADALMNSKPAGRFMETARLNDAPGRLTVPL